MAKEGVEKAEETEQMIEKEAGKEPAEGGGGGGSHRLGDAQEMRAVVLAGFGGLNKLRVTRKAMPEPQDGELKIRVKACGLNFIDLMVRQGNIDNPPKTPLVPGFECSGIVEALGDSVKGYEIGDRVMAFVNYNAWAEVVCTPVEFVYKIPDDMSFSEAAAFPMNFVTAYMMLFEVANLREGMSVLVHSAGGGVGQAVAQLCSTIPNVTVFGTASTFKHEAIKDSVTHLFDRNADYVQEVKRISAEGVDIVLDCLCGDNTGKGLSLLKPLGTYILYGSSNMVTGETKSFFSFAKSWWQVEKVNPIKLFEENKVIAGFSLLNLLFKQGRAGLIRGVVDKLIGLYTQKKIKPVVDSLWALEEVKEAMQRIHDRGNIGKLILDVEKTPTPLMANDSTETSEAGEEEEDHEGDSENKERMPFIQ
ncbi:synaptic vesicle membrane protein VAT-1 homolog-like isoform X1 [Equus asinus]|uniref:Vesicle amine transport 1 like n=3 Tax=Equus TaxID=9789 RepID=F7BQE9_HORSE|nr:synaptic vesicle membrane protein VAT-1 homolog-like isoform X2 [Equus asinus]XP_023493131.1 synaptic vesicle membrane protein VAT-1 homolog-like [Equus caballus]XP_046538821.1 synaptic vesicle membrane protein VAT-1 homolog-like [Equus quagga]